MKLSEHKISKVLKEQDTKKASAAAGETSGHTKLACYAVKILNENNIVASYENICAAMWTMFPKIDRFHLYGFDDISRYRLYGKMYQIARNSFPFCFNRWK